MRIIVQRVKNCSVSVKELIVGKIEYGLLVYLGVEKGDSSVDLNYLQKKIISLRIFNDINAQMNLSVKDINASILVVSQFTICADTRKGNRPSYNNAEKPDIARKIYLSFIEKLKETGLNIQSGEFQEKMEVSSTNDGPVTILLDSRKIF
ncbi:MAG: D-aminoacyl-tRNA deacylase [Spirochaetia bacterium]|jgi:D-tyrosyl-tRNA(Tyr) deacylase|nr:D-aminoacyl-tRNA deacylase [Spirochaetia bacterium]